MSVSQTFLAILFVTTCLISINLAGQDGRARKIDEYGRLFTDDESARLDTFYLALHNQPDLKGYIVGYNDPPGLRGQFLRRIYGDWRYLTKYRGLDPNRIIVLNGGYREKFTIELWVVPPEATPPKPAPTLPQWSGSPSGAYKFDEECIVCEPAVNLDLYALDAGISFFADALHEDMNSRGEIIIQPDKGMNAHEAKDMAERARGLLVDKYHIEFSRIGTRIGRKGTGEAEFWVRR